MKPDVYEVVSVSQAVEEAVPEADDWASDWLDNDWAALVVRYADDGMAIIGGDGCEPEDNSLFRSYAWISGALQEAYQRGIEHGRAQAG